MVILIIDLLMRLRFHGGLVLAAVIAENAVAAKLLAPTDLSEAAPYDGTTLAQIFADSTIEVDQETKPATIQKPEDAKKDEEAKKKVEDKIKKDAKPEGAEPAKAGDPKTKAESKKPEKTAAKAAKASDKAKELKAKRKAEDQKLKKKASQPQKVKKIIKKKPGKFDKEVLKNKL